MCVLVSLFPYDVINELEGVVRGLRIDCAAIMQRFRSDCAAITLRLRYDFLQRLRDDFATIAQHTRQLRSKCAIIAQQMRSDFEAILKRF